ncbi:MAG: hypothetical protein FJ125_17890 [Deltaproteobacteria bacterium]|nr:hypothetical protein [Deltaproteobacteria bacterium]
MTVWILDDGPFGMLSDVLTPPAAAAWPKGRFWTWTWTWTADRTERRPVDAPAMTLVGIKAAVST